MCFPNWNTVGISFAIDKPGERTAHLMAVLCLPRAQDGQMADAERAANDCSICAKFRDREAKKEYSVNILRLLEMANDSA
jgi:hypothetical protein